MVAQRKRKNMRSPGWLYKIWFFLFQLNGKGAIHGDSSIKKANRLCLVSAGLS